MESVLQIIFALILLELLELYLHQANTLSDLIDKLYGYYRESIFLFFLVHPTFYFVLGVLIYFNAFNFYGITVLMLKVFDIFFRIELIKQRYYLPSMDAELKKMMEMKLTFSMKFLALFVHVPLLYMAIGAAFG